MSSVNKSRKCTVVAGKTDRSVVGDPSLKKKGLYLSWQVRHIFEKGKLYFLGVVRFIVR